MSKPAGEEDPQPATPGVCSTLADTLASTQAAAEAVKEAHAAKDTSVSERAEAVQLIEDLEARTTELVQLMRDYANRLRKEVTS